MTTKPSSKRDWLDYLDIIVKILSGGILAIVTFILSHNNELKQKENELRQQEITNSIKYGEFTKALMNDLLTQDSTHFRNDIALITLNRTIGDDNKQN
jgi:hypothetical protein